MNLEEGSSYILFNNDYSSFLFLNRYKPVARVAKAPPSQPIALLASPVFGKVAFGASAFGIIEALDSGFIPLFVAFELSLLLVYLPSVASYLVV